MTAENKPPLRSADSVEKFGHVKTAQKFNSPNSVAGEMYQSYGVYHYETEDGGNDAATFKNYLNGMCRWLYQTGAFISGLVIVFLDHKFSPLVQVDNFDGRGHSNHVISDIFSYKRLEMRVFLVRDQDHSAFRPGNLLGAAVQAISNKYQCTKFLRKGNANLNTHETLALLSKTWTDLQPRQFLNNWKDLQQKIIEASASSLIFKTSLVDGGSDSKLDDQLIDQEGLSHVVFGQTEPDCSDLNEDLLMKNCDCCGKSTALESGDPARFCGFCGCKF